MTDTHIKHNRDANWISLGVVINHASDTIGENSELPVWKKICFI